MDLVCLYCAALDVDAELEVLSVRALEVDAVPDREGVVPSPTSTQLKAKAASEIRKGVRREGKEVLLALRRTG